MFMLFQSKQPAVCQSYLRQSGREADQPLGNPETPRMHAQPPARVTPVPPTLIWFWASLGVSTLRNSPITGTSGLYTEGQGG